MRKYCIVPMCTNSSRKTPQKLFFSVPNGNKIRKKWLKVMKRAAPVSSISRLHCCEDHFDIENDMDNYIKYKLVGGILKLKKGVVPHKFLCQKPQKVVKERLAVKKRRINEIINKFLHEEYIPATSNIEEIFVEPPKTENLLEKVNKDPLDSLETNYEVNSKPGPVKKCNKRTQVCIKTKTRTKSTMTDDHLLKKRSRANESKKREANVGLELCTEDTDCENFAFNDHMQKTTVLCISQESELLLGLPKQCYFIIDLLSEHCKLKHRDIMITLKKIRLYQSNALLALDFGLTSKSIAMIFRKTIPAVATCMKSLIFFPDSEDVTANLPMAFRKKYSNVQSIIDCLEVQIEKPPNAIEQTLTWSESKGCNTIKYLISITPDGLINYVSEGYGGRTSDLLIFKDCGILKELPRNSAILAYQGFKNIDHLLIEKKCTLIRPPSVSSSVSVTKDDVIETEIIACLHIHVEISIGKICNFGFLMPHACVDYKQVDLLDSIIVVACGIINLQSRFFDPS